MDFLLDALTDWLKEMLVGGIMSNLSGMFDSVNQQVADIATQVGQTPQGWNGSIFSMIQNLSKPRSTTSKAAMDHLCQCFQNHIGRISLGLLNIGNLFGRNMGFISQLFLRQIFFFSCCAECLPQSSQIINRHYRSPQ